MVRGGRSGQTGGERGEGRRGGGVRVFRFNTKWLFGVVYCSITLHHSIFGGFSIVHSSPLRGVWGGLCCLLGCCFFLFIFPYL